MHPCPLAKTLVSVFLAGALAGCSGEDLYLGTPLALGGSMGMGMGGGAPEPTAPPTTTTEPPPGRPMRPTMTFGSTSINVSAKLAKFGWGDGEDEDNVSFDRNGLQMFFSSERSDQEPDTGDDVFVATSATPWGEFDRVDRVMAANTAESETSPCVSLDGLTLWVAQRPDDDDYDIFYITRERADMDVWSPAQPEQTLNSSADDIPRPLGWGDTVMPLARRADGNQYLTYFATREDTGARFTMPVPAGGSLVEDEAATVDGFLSGDGTLLFFNWEYAEDRGELYMAWRPTPADPFEVPRRLTDYGLLAGYDFDDSDQRDPWLSPDMRTLYYSSNHEDTEKGRNIYAVDFRLDTPDTGN
jgi:hypothetical protein